MNPIRRKLASGEVLFQQGTPADSFFLVLNGVISLYHERGGKTVEKARMTNNQIVGDLTYFMSAPRKASARAVVDTELAEFRYSEIQAGAKTLPGWTQLMLKSFAEQLGDVNRELAHFQSGDTSELLTLDEILKGTASLRLAFQTIPPENDSWEWSKVRDYSFQVFQIATLKLEPIAQALIKQGWMTGQEGEFGLSQVNASQPERIHEFESFIRQYKSSRTKRAMIDVNDIDLISLGSLIATAEGQTDRKGAARVELSKALTVAQLKPGGKSFRVDQFDLLLSKGLDIMKESTDSGIQVSFNLLETTKIYENWQILHRLCSGTKS
jgi:hypothetical protein